MNLGKFGHLCISPVFKAGDPCPDGYLERYEWAQVQLKAGLRQSQCRTCGRYFFPQETHACAAKGEAGRS